MLDAFFFVNLGELSIFLKDAYDLKEEQFWKMVRETVDQYQKRFSDLAPRFQVFDLFASKVEVEQLTKRRLFQETELRVHQVRNPLARITSKEGGNSLETE